MPSHHRRPIITLLSKVVLITLLTFAILLLGGAPSSEACGNQSCNGDACSEAANTTCVFKTRTDGTVYCVTVNCSSTIGGVEGDS